MKYREIESALPRNEPTPRARVLAALIDAILKWEDPNTLTDLNKSLFEHQKETASAEPFAGETADAVVALSAVDEDASFTPKQANSIPELEKNQTA